MTLTDDQYRELAERLAPLWYPTDTFGENAPADRQKVEATRITVKEVLRFVEGRGDARQPHG